MLALVLVLALALALVPELALALVLVLVLVLVPGLALVPSWRGAPRERRRRWRAPDSVDHWDVLGHRPGDGDRLCT